jgi:hypothetical protein
VKPEKLGPPHDVEPAVVMNESVFGRNVVVVVVAIIVVVVVVVVRSGSDVVVDGSVVVLVVVANVIPPHDNGPSRFNVEPVN